MENKKKKTHDIPSEEEFVADETNSGDLDETALEEEFEVRHEDEAAATASNEDEQADELVMEQEAASKSRTDKKASKKQAKQEKKTDPNKEKIEQLEDRIKRQMAEFDNFRKRTEREKSVMFEIGAKSIIEKILPVVDNFERGLSLVPEDSKQDPFVEGMNKVYRQMLSELANLGIKEIEAVGQEFNPEYHNAVMQVESDTYEPGVVAQELQKGYLYRDSVVRHSMVAVVGES
ncbi:MAG: nucleotide exchange factor GrpE [Clostridium sp.]|jgi:molecular chaperone GrpE|nr:nucleotide exchange factor GrpE [Clostridium sp.]